MLKFTKPIVENLQGKNNTQTIDNQYNKIKKSLKTV